MKVPLFPFLGVIFAIISFSESNPFLSKWKTDIDSFSRKVAGIFNGTTTPLLTGSIYTPDEWYKIVQDKIPESEEFPCCHGHDRPRWRSRKRPDSVHELRPGDIDIIASVGDSLSAGTAAREFTPLGVFTDDRGVSFVGGGMKTWREFTTLPNILKNFNPHLYGYAIGKGTFFSDNAQLNVAIAGSIDDNLLDQVKFLIFKMSTDSKINVTTDWKLLNMFIGHNDISSFQCLDPVKHSAEAHRLRIKEALDLLYVAVPKLFVNLISILDPSLTVRTPSNPGCDILRKMLTPCLFVTPNLRQNIVKMSSIAREYQKVEMELASSENYQGREDFAVVCQPFFQASNGPMKIREPEDPEFSQLFSSKMPIMTPDCFHINQRGSAIAAIALWNNMLEPVGNKTDTVHGILHQTIKCPSKSRPFLFTAKNSKPCNKKCHH